MKWTLPLITCGIMLVGCRIDSSDRATERRHSSNTAPASELSYVQRQGSRGTTDLYAIHGLGDTPENLAHLFNNQYFYRHLYLPRAPKPYYEGFSWFDVSIPLQTTPADSLAEDIQTAAGLICDFIKQNSTTPAIVTGFSQGGVLSYAAALHCPERIACALPMSGMLPKSLIDDISPQKKYPPIHAFHGQADTVVPLHLDLDTVDQLQKTGISAHIQTYRAVPHTISPQMRADLFQRIRICNKERK